MKLLAAGENRRRDGVDLRCGEDEDEVGRWLLDDLEESVESLSREAVDLVDDHDLVAVAGRSVFEALRELANLLDLGVGRGIDFDDIEVGAGGDLAAGLAVVTGVCGRPILAVECLGEHSRDAGLANPTDTGE